MLVHFVGCFLFFWLKSDQFSSSRFGTVDSSPTAPLSSKAMPRMHCSVRSLILFLLAIASPWAPNFSVARKGTAAPEVGFGKHKGRTMYEVLSEESGYCQYVVDEYMYADPKNCGRAFREMAEWLRQNKPELFNYKERKMGFGKHRDQSWDWVIENDRGYTNHAISIPNPAGSMRRFALYAKKKRQAGE